MDLKYDAGAIGDSRNSGSPHRQKKPAIVCGAVGRLTSGGNHQHNADAAEKFPPVSPGAVICPEHGKTLTTAGVSAPLLRAVEAFSRAQYLFDF